MWSDDYRYLGLILYVGKADEIYPLASHNPKVTILQILSRLTTDAFSARQG